MKNKSLKKLLYTVCLVLMLIVPTVASSGCITMSTLLVSCEVGNIKAGTEKYNYYLDDSRYFSVEVTLLDWFGNDGEESIVVSNGSGNQKKENFYDYPSDDMFVIPKASVEAIRESGFELKIDGETKYTIIASETSEKFEREFLHRIVAITEETGAVLLDFETGKDNFLKSLL